jgi:tetratricopeptide (TPR) repeat protein
MEGKTMLRTLIRPVVVGVACAAALAAATPAFAQKGTLKGYVIQENGDPAAQVRVNFVSVDDPNKKASALTDRFGQFLRNNLDPGLWNLEAERFGKIARFHKVTVKPGQTREIANMVLRDPSAPPVVEETTMTADEAEKRRARIEELKTLFAQAEASVNTGDYADALAKLNEVAAEVEKCAACYARMGDVYRRQGDLAAAEKAFKQAIDFDPAMPDAYSALATIYNEQRRYDEAAAMSAKATDLSGAAGSGDGTAAFNQGVILWNQSKFPEAGEAFDKARKADPKMADAHFRFAMAMVNQGKLAEAKEPLETYLKLAPNGDHAAEAQELLKVIK